MAIQRIVVQAPAKINLYLGVSLQRTLVGYHRLSTLMGTVGLYDQVTLEPSDRLSLICRPSVRTSMENNTASMAALFFAEALDRPADVAITLDKTIPAQAGLGGGSADAAAVLLGLCAAWGIDPFDPLVHGVAASVGADVPFFLTGGLALMGGAGDQLEETFSAVPFHAVLVRPGGVGVSTPRAYEAFDAHPEPAAPLEPLVDAVAAANVDAMSAACAQQPGARCLRAFACDPSGGAVFIGPARSVKRPGHRLGELRVWALPRRWRRRRRSHRGRPSWLVVQGRVFHPLWLPHRRGRLARPAVGIEAFCFAVSSGVRVGCSVW